MAGSTEYNALNRVEIVVLIAATFVQTRHWRAVADEGYLHS